MTTLGLSSNNNESLDRVVIKIQGKEQYNLCPLGKDNNDDK